MKTLPPLGKAVRSGCPCKICGSKSLPFDTVDFNKYCSHDDFYSFGFSGVRVDYYRCPLCEAVFTPSFDEWSSDDFKIHVYNDDYIKVDSEYESVRPRFVAHDMASRWGDCFDARVLDYGSGAGVFAEELRRLGYRNVEAFDPFSNPRPPSGKFDIVTCFEVIEHATSPGDALAKMCSYMNDDGCIIVSQTLQPPDIMQVRGSWWYLGPRNGHICTFTANTLAYLAEEQGLTFFAGFHDGPHAFARGRLSSHATSALATIGKAHYFVPLFAPACTGDHEKNGHTPWYGGEVAEEGAFRWLGARQVEWPAPAMPHLPATVSIKLPHIDAMTKELLAGSVIRIGGDDFAVQVRKHSLTVDFCALRPFESVELRTPELVIPRALRGDDDDRLLGIAVPLKQK